MHEFDLSRLKRCGTDVRISPRAVIKHPELVAIGDHVAIDDFCYISTALEVGSFVHVSAFTSIIGGRDATCHLDDFSGIAAGGRLICGSDDYLGSGMTNPTVPRRYHAEVRLAPIRLSRHSLLGTNCVVHPGVVLGEGAVVGSCSLVTRDLEPWQVYIGIPARRVKSRPSARILDLEAQLRAEAVDGQ